MGKHFEPHAADFPTSCRLDPRLAHVLVALICARGARARNVAPTQPWPRAAPITAFTPAAYAVLWGLL